MMLALFSYHCNFLCRFLAKNKAAFAAFFLTNLRVLCLALRLFFCLIFHIIQALNHHSIAGLFVAGQYLF
ncbi:hypothetical protein [Aeromonas caviae]|uniref:hypothetical protein n=1 Tax=Aeromonas caviae TaxID=648 RepID=UPI003CF7B469